MRQHAIPEWASFDFWEVTFINTSAEMGVRVKGACGCNVEIDVCLTSFRLLPIEAQQQFGAELLIQAMRATDASHSIDDRLNARVCLMLSHQQVVASWDAHLAAWLAEEPRRG